MFQTDLVMDQESNTTGSADEFIPPVVGEGVKFQFEKDQAKLHEALRKAESGESKLHTLKEMIHLSKEM